MRLAPDKQVLSSSYFDLIWVYNQMPNELSLLFAMQTQAVGVLAAKFAEGGAGRGFGGTFR